MSNITIKLAQETDQARWDDFVLSHPDGLPYHLFAWKQTVESAYGFFCPYFLAECNDKVVGVLPTAHLHWPLRSGTLVSLPYCDVGGPLADSPNAANDLLEFALEYAGRHVIPDIELRMCFSPRYLNNSKPQYPKAKKVRLLLPLPDDSQALMASFKAKVRSQIKKPVRDGLKALLGGNELFDDFYSVFCRNMRDLGSPVHSRSWFHALFRSYGSRAKCGVVFMPDGTPAACGIILCHSRTVSIPWASSLRILNKYNPNMLIYWTFLAFATDNGYECFDFGRSTPGEGTYKFKEQWGAIPEPLSWWRMYVTSRTSQPLGNGQMYNGRTRALAAQAIGKLPVPAATFLGSRIRKYISL